MKVDNLINEIKAGKTLYIQTCLKITKVDAKCIKRFEKSGNKVLKDGKDGESGFYIASGRNFVYVNPNVCKVSLKWSI